MIFLATFKMTITCRFLYRKYKSMRDMCIVHTALLKVSVFTYKFYACQSLICLLQDKAFAKAPCSLDLNEKQFK